jgi:hypothetical protein
MNGPLLSRSHGLRLVQSLSTFLTPGQTPKVAETVSQTLDALFQGLHRGPLQEKQEKQKKQKKQKQSSSFTSASPSLAISLATLFRLASYVLPGLPASSLPATAFENLQTTIRSLTANTILPAAVLSVDRFRDGHDEAWVWSAVGAAALHLYSAVEVQCRWAGGLPTLEEQVKQKMMVMLQKQGPEDLSIEVVSHG